MSVLPASRAVTERGLVPVRSLRYGDVVLSKDARFHKLACSPIPRYVDTTIIWIDGLGVTFDTKLRLASGAFTEVARTPDYTPLMCVAYEDWEEAIARTPRAELRPRGMVIDRGSCHIALGIAPVAVFGRVLFTSNAAALEMPPRVLVEYAGIMFDLSVDGENSFVAERFVSEGL
jgi:hypothetical protein